LHNPQRGKHPAQWIDWPTNREGQTSAFAQLRRHLAPGFVLVSRAQLLADHVSALQKERADSTALDALLDLCALHYTPPTLTTADAEIDTGEGDESADVQAVNLPTVASKDWTVSRRKPGWLVPLPVGYAAISQLYAPGEVKNARDNDTAFRFVESVLSLGEWVGPHRIKNLHDLLWRHHAQPEAGLYVTHNGAAVTSPTPASTPV
jgi:CRISPR-associated protein Csy2